MFDLFEITIKTDIFQILRIRTFVLLIITAVNFSFAEILTPDYSGECHPSGWIPHKALEQPKLGLALSGGGFRGIAHIGVLKSLEKHGIQLDLIAGTSMGAIIGALYASGYSVDEIKTLVKKTDWEQVFLDRPSRRNLFLTQKRTRSRHIFQIRFKNWKPYIPPAITSGQKISMLLDDLCMRAIYQPDPDFDHLKIPFRAIATDLITGDKVVFSRGELSKALRATSSFPVVFSPLKMNGSLLVDGGMLENVPVPTALEMGADKVIAVDCTSPLVTEVSELWEIVNQITSIMIEESTLEDLSLADVVITPVPPEEGSFELESLDSLIAYGESRTDEKIEEIRSLLAEAEPNTQELFVPSVIEYIAPEDFPVEHGDLLEAGSPVSKLTIVKHLNMLYKKYELSDMYAKINFDTVKIHLFPSPTFKTIQIRGNKVLADSLILKAVKSVPGKPLSYTGGVKDKENIIRLYRDRGYALAEIDTSYLENDTLYIWIDEGTISRLTVFGGRKRALLDLGLYEGRVFNWIDAKKGLDKIYSTDLYETVRLDVGENEVGKNIVLALDPRPFPLIRLGQRYDTERSWNFLFELITADIFKTDLDLTLLAVPGSKDNKIGVDLGSDHVFRNFLYFNLSFYYEKNKYNLYDIEHHDIGDYSYEKNYAAARIGQLISRWGLVSACLHFENTISTHPAEGERNPHSVSLILETNVDTYDRYPFPRSGSNIKLMFKSTSEIGKSGEIETPALEYNKIYGEIQRYTPLAKRYTLLLRLRAGYVETDVPTYEKFTFGGIHDFGGLHEREAIGNRLLTGSAGLRFDLLSRILAEASVAIRYDVGQIQDGADFLEFKRSFFRQGVTVSLALNTVLGPVEAGWGYAFKYKNIPENHLFYFTIGHEL